MNRAFCTAAHGISLAFDTEMSNRQKKQLPLFKRCTLCKKEWQTRQEFLDDRDLRLEGYQWNYMKVVEGMPPEGVLVFTHLRAECGTSIAVAANAFKKEFNQDT